jgi:hypothetical protein
MKRDPDTDSFALYRFGSQAYVKWAPEEIIVGAA